MSKKTKKSKNNTKIIKEEFKYPLGSEEYSRELRDKYEISSAVAINLHKDFRDTIKTYEEITEEIKALKRKKKVIEHMIQSEMKTCDTAFCEDIKITWKTIRKNIVDTKYLKESNLLVYNECIRESTSRVFKVIK